MKTWSDIKQNQPVAGQILMNSIQKKRISHAYLISGDRGTGKEVIAIHLAKSILCPYKRDDVEPCQHCSVCKRISSKNYPDVHWIEPDGQSIRIEQIKNLQREFTYSGLETNEKVYILKYAETLTANAANRILKFLEEPTHQTTAILLTENRQLLLPTVRSRCQLIDLQPLNQEDFQERLLQSGVDNQEAKLISALTRNLSEARELLANEWFAETRKLMLQLIEIYLTRREDVYLFIHKKWLPHFKDRQEQEQGIDLLILAFKDMLYCHVGKQNETVIFSENDPRLEKAITIYSQQKLIQILQHLLEAKRKLRQNVHPTLVIEQLTLRI